MKGFRWIHDQVTLVVHRMDCLVEPFSLFMSFLLLMSIWMFWWQGIGVCVRVWVHVSFLFNNFLLVLFYIFFVLFLFVFDQKKLPELFHKKALKIYNIHRRTSVLESLFKKASSFIEKRLQNFKNTYFEEHLPTITSVWFNEKQDKNENTKISMIKNALHCTKNDVFR